MFPEGVAIDLDGSTFPGLFRQWRPPSNEIPLPIYPDAGGVPNPDVYSPQMDILFSQRGTLFGAQQSQGILHFRIAYLSDIEMVRGRIGRPRNRNHENASVPADPERDHKAVSIFSETGQIVVSEINPAADTSNPGFNNDRAVNPFWFAIRGREAN